MTTGLTAMTWVVTNPEATAAFYRTLGIPVSPPHVGDPTWMLFLDPTLIQLWKASDRHPATRMGITLTVDPEVLDRFPDAERVTPRGCVAVTDPDGNRVVLVARRDVGDVVGDII